MSASTFASSVTSADIHALQSRFDDLEKLINDKFNALNTVKVPITTSTVPPISGLSGILPPSSNVNLSDIFPKEGGRKKTKRNKK